MTNAETESIVSDFAEKREELNEQANRHRDLRDRLNDETKKWANHRDDLNAKVRGIIDRANEHKARRDALNRDVRAAKADRDALNQVANEKAEALNELKRERMPREGPNLHKLKQEAQRLEYEHQTKVLTPKKEKELIERLQGLLKEIALRERTYEADEELRNAYEAMKEAKAAAEAQHQRVTELANAAQAEHDGMVALFGEADKYRKEADNGQAMFVKSKVEADKVHHEYIGYVSQVRDLEKVMHALRPSSRRPARGGPSSGAMAEAEDIFDRFKKGEKLSTEDLMSLQKAGLI